MLYRELLHSELVSNKEEFKEFASMRAAEVDAYLSVLLPLVHQSSNIEKLAKLPAPGAVPTLEFIQNKGICVPFQETWQNHEESRNWAEGILEKRMTFAADGSQIYFQNETSLPVGAVQIGWFLNPHDGGTDYEKDASLKILTPKVLLEKQEEPFNPETRVGEARFHEEVGRVSELIERCAGWEARNESMPLGFFDGTMLISISLPHTSLQEGFMKAMRDLVALSKDRRVPVVGYIDRSFARDIVSMTEALDDSLGSKSVFDATLLSSKSSKHSRLLESWGDRTVFFGAKRNGLQIFSEDGDPLVGFVYLQTTSSDVPARVDVPFWIYEAGLLNEVIDVVRAECVVGLGYPYPLETADAAALISNRDRQVFLAALLRFSETEGFDFSVSRKNVSKGRRR